MADLTKGAKGFDQNLATAVVKRFLTYNQYRLERTQLALTERQRVLLDIIGLLYHVNHEKLPGFVGYECPCGVARYSPTKDTLRAAAGLAMGFQYSQRRSGQTTIKSMFIMGSCGSLGHSGGSDLDIWLCHEPSIAQDELDLLQEKASAIEKWADNIGLEVHFFLMDAEKFVKGDRNDLDGEDCGSAQHHLLLDEFYRTSILLCGCYPLWWLVPVEHENNYDDFVYRLQTQGFVQPEEVIDFGGIGSIPAGEFVGAGMWQLYKAIGSPYKSILKLFLTEAYASSLSGCACAEFRFKSANV
ncbi:class I adenylate cyclase [Pseudomonas sp. HK3]